ncbi:hypothetical protein J2W35_004249 [Variovorax boronicumulans]|uniref:hypothetical protein n=1 Tax=Variovorax boronicumulans TaxID=436515 RepID=UPI002781FF70|nr:hypothetical protein [Variovorax boronicumulans]
MPSRLIARAFAFRRYPFSPSFPRCSACRTSEEASNGYAISQRKRKLIEQGFGWAKFVGPIRQVMVRGIKKVVRVRSGERREVVAQALSDGERLRLVQHVVAHERVDIAQVLRRLCPVQQPERKIVVNSQASLEAFPERRMSRERRRDIGHGYWRNEYIDEWPASVYRMKCA